MGTDPWALAPQQQARTGAILAERLAATVQEEVPAPGAPVVGVSIGVVSCPEHGDDATLLVERADRAMYRAKATGDRVALAECDHPKPAEEAKRH